MFPGLWLRDNGSEVVFGHYGICGQQPCSQGSLLPILGNEVVWTEGKHPRVTISVKIPLGECASSVEYSCVKA